LDLGGGGVARVDDEIGVLLRHTCATQAFTLQACCLDQASRMIPWRIAEHRAATRLADRLCAATLFQQRLDASRGSLSVAWNQAQVGREKPLPIRSAHAPIPDPIFLRHADAAFAATVNDLHGVHPVP